MRKTMSKMSMRLAATAAMPITVGIPYILYVSDHLQTQKSNSQFINDDTGTQFVDFSFLIPQAGGIQPKIIYGPENGLTAVDVITVSVP